MRQLTLTAVFLFCSIGLFSQIFTSKPGSTSISFFSEAPLENIEATSSVATIVFQSTSSDLQARLQMQSFKFKNALMREHFNENYVESDKYPNAEFRGKLNEKIDLTREGETKVTCTGKMTMHGVTKDVTLDGTVTKTGDELKFAAKFPMKVADYNIKVPSMYVKNIAEVVEVNFNTVLEPFKKK